MSKKILITGIAGFIGFHLAKRLAINNEIIGIDNLNDYYSPKLKIARLEELGVSEKNIREGKVAPSTSQNIRFLKTDLVDPSFTKFIQVEKPQIIIHLAAQAGVRHSLSHPDAYIHSNILGFFQLLESCRTCLPEHFLFASSSSVYGLNDQIPFSETQQTDSPASLYAATKKSNELLAYSYSHLFKIPTTALRFFTVYGPFGRPDMAYYNFVEKIANNEPITLFNDGDMLRDFTYVDDVTEAISLLIPKTPQSDSHSVLFDKFNIGNNSPISLSEFVRILESNLGKKARIQYAPLQSGDIKTTFAEINHIRTTVGWSPKTTPASGLHTFVEWWKKYTHFVL